MLSFIPAKLPKIYKEDIKIYPNPATNQTTITYPLLNSEGELLLYNMLGQIVYEEKLVEGSSYTKLNLQNYKAGLYKVLLRENGIIKGEGSVVKE